MSRSGLSFSTQVKTMFDQLVTKLVSSNNPQEDLAEIQLISEELKTAMHARERTPEVLSLELFAEISQEDPDLDTVLELLDAGARPNFKDPKTGISLLQIAAKNDQAQIVKTLIDRGAGVLQKDKNRRTALHEAAHFASPELVKILLDSGASTLAQDSRQRTPLHEAAESGSIEKIQLLKHDVDINCQDQDGLTPLMLALDSGYEKLVDLLVELGGNIESRDCENRTPLIRATKAEQEDIVTTLLELGADANLIDSEGRTALIHASINGQGPIATTLLEFGADPNVEDDFSKTAIRYSLENHYPEIAKRIKEVYPIQYPFDTMTEHNKTVELLELLEKFDKETTSDKAKKADLIKIEKLFSEGANANGCINKNRQPNAMIAAVKTRDPRILQIFFQWGANPNILASGMPIIATALSTGDVKLCQLFQDAGANLDYVDTEDDSNHCSLLRSARTYETAKFLFDNSLGDFVDIRDCLDIACDKEESCDYRLIELLLQKGAMRKRPACICSGLRDFPPLYSALLLDENVHLGQLLIRYGAHVDAEIDGLTLLQEAFFSNKIEVARLLLANGADENRVIKKIPGNPSKRGCSLTDVLHSHGSPEMIEVFKNTKRKGENDTNKP